MNRWLAVLALYAISCSSVFAEKVVFITTGAQRDTVKLLNILRAQGHEVTNWNTTVSGNSLTASNYAAQGYQLLVVDEVISSGAVANRFKYSPIPVINMEAFIYGASRSAFNLVTGGAATYASAGDAAAANGGLGADAGQVTQLTKINVVNPSHPLAAGLPAGEIDVFDPNHVATINLVEGNGVITFAGTRTFITNGVHIAATVPGFDGGMAVFGVEAGVTNADTTTNMARWVGLPWNDTQQADRVMVEPSFFLFEAAIAWALNKPQPTKIRDLTPAGGSYFSTNTTISFTVDKLTAAGSAVASGNIQLRLNGSNVIANATITDGGTNWVVTYTNALKINTAYSVVASATAADGGFSARMATIDTFDQNNFSFEAEDFNFGGGMFFTNIIPCHPFPVGSVQDDCYFDRVGFTNIDKFEVNFTAPAIPVTNEVYRFGTGATREEFVDTFLTPDPTLRQKYITAALPDYEVRNIAINEWLNYTRTYPTGTFNIYARVSSAGAMTVQMDLVSGDATTTNQTPLTKLGRFVKPSGSAGYELVPLTDDSGQNMLAVEFDGSIQTIRVTALSAGFLPNFYMFVRSASAVNQPPTVAVLTPTNGTVYAEGQMVTLTASTTDDGSVTNVQYFAGTAEPLTLVGQATSPPYTVQWTPPSLGQFNTYKIRAVATDDGGLGAANESVDMVRVIDPALAIVTTANGVGADAEMRENDNGDTANGTGPSMNVRQTITTGTINRHEVIALRFDLGATNMSQISTAALNLFSHRDLSAQNIHVYGVIDGTVGVDNNGATPAYTDDTWDEALTTFSTMPGLIWDANVTTADHTNVVDLGLLNLGLNKGQVWRFSTPELLSFLQTNDNVVTFLLEQETDSNSQSRFSTKEAGALQDDTPLAPAGTTNWFAPFLSFKVGAVTPPGISIQSFSREGNQLTLRWSGGTPPYVIRKRGTIGGIESDELTGINTTNATVTLTGNEGYFRVQGQ
jgi:hypothetical protein